LKRNHDIEANSHNLSNSLLSRSILPVFLITITLICLLAFFASPVSDDYCFAYGTREFGFFDNFQYFVSNWSPSLGYLWLSLPWELNLSLVQVSSIFCIFTLVGSGIILRLAIRNSIVTFETSSQRNVLFLISIGFITSIAAVQSSVFFTSKSAQNAEVFGVVRDWVKSNFFSERDGVLLRWALSTPLTSVKLILASWLLLLASTIAKELYRKNYKKISMVVLLNSLIAMLIGVSVETMTAIGFMFLTILRQLWGKNNHRKNLFLLVALLFVLVTYLFAPGSEKRQTNLFNSSLQDFVFVFLGVIWQFIWITLTIFVVAKLFRSYLRSIVPQGFRLFSSNSETVFGYLFIASLGNQIVLETLVYPAAYHWISYCLITFLYFFLILERQQPITENQLPASLFRLLSFMIASLLLCMSLVSTVASSQNRYSDVQNREKGSINKSENMIKNVPLIDNSGIIYAQDLEADFGSIVPFSGFTLKSNMYCYKKLDFK
jgi:hypothetical protein